MVVTLNLVMLTTIIVSLTTLDLARVQCSDELCSDRHWQM